MNKANLTVHAGECIGFVGRNGCGKSSFLKILSETDEADSGKIMRRRDLTTSYLSQEFTLDISKNVYDEIGEGYDFIKLGDEKISIWSYLKRFLFDDDRIKTNIAQLSGGEKGRLLLAKILKNGGNFIILDEPTNDLDLLT